MIWLDVVILIRDLAQQLRAGGSWFNPQHPHVASQLSNSNFRGPDVLASSGTKRAYGTYIHTYMYECKTPIYTREP